MNLDETKGVVGFTCGAFDLLHPGHLFLIRECAKRCDYLIVGLHTDPTIDRPDTKNRPIQSVFERWYQLIALGFNGEIIPYETERDLEHMLGVLPINVRFIGMDYMGKKITGEKMCQDRSIDIEYIERLHDWSSTELRTRLAK